MVAPSDTRRKATKPKRARFRREGQRVVEAAGKAIAELRAERGMSQAELAERSGVRRSHIGMLERGLRSGSLPAYEAIAISLGTTLHALLAREGAA